MSMRKAAFGLLKGLAKILSDMKVEGLENLPKEGPVIVTPAHTSRLDTPLLMLSTKRTDLIPMVAQEYRKSPLGPLLNALGVIWIDRKGYDFKAFQEAQSYLHKGYILGIAPEGKRSRTGKLIEGKPGAALIAKKTGVRLISAIVEGATTMAEAISHFRKMQVRIIFGKVYDLPEQMEDEGNKAWLVRATDEIMAHIAILLPEGRRGFYANHPRVLELLKEESRVSSDPY